MAGCGVVPMTQKNVILAGLAFDHGHDLWVQQYVDQDNALPGGPDHIIKIDRSILTTAAASTLSEEPLRASDAGGLWSCVGDDHTRL